jgi:hypothetical protein
VKNSDRKNPVQSAIHDGQELYYIAEAKFGDMSLATAPSRSGAMNGWSIKVAAKGGCNAFMHCRAGDGCLAAGY